MTIDCNKLKNWPFKDVVQSYDDRDTILYALSMGLGANPTDEAQLKYLYEKELVALPMMANVLGYPGLWIREPESGIDWKKVLHGEQSMVIHKQLPATGTIIGRTRVRAIIDKGPGKGALLLQERKILEKASGELLATVEGVTFARGDGGFSENGGADGKQVSDPPPPAPYEVPKRDADMVELVPTLSQMALIYRLLGDRHPMHVEPAVAKAAGFPRPILHGLGTFGVAGCGILKSCCGYDSTKLKSMRVRFTSPFFPGETLRMELWKEANGVGFRAKAVERDLLVLNNGFAELN
jgi:acyl dehydratase